VGNSSGHEIDGGVKHSLQQTDRKAEPDMIKIKLKVLDTEVEYEGNEKFPASDVIPLLEAAKKSHNEQVKENLLVLQGELEQELHSMNNNVSTISEINEKIDDGVMKFQQWIKSFVETIGASSGSDSGGGLLNAVRQMQETQMSFNLQYLQLQSQMQNENRQYSAVSNIMKTKHDTVKNSISNIR
jgi:hypothetical protein